MNIDLHYATVIKNDSTLSPSGLKNGGIQVKIPYLMDGINDDDLDWALPFHLSTGGSNESGLTCIPEIGSLVWVFFYDQENNKKLYYIADVNLTNFGASNLFEDNVKSNITGFTSAYPDIKNLHLKNGVNIALSSNDDNPEIAVYHPQGSYIFINKNGEIQIKAGSVAIEKTILGETLKTKLEALIDAINAITVPTGVGPSGTPINEATFITLKSELTQILSAKIKNN
jgi:hypothetical protein